MAKLSKNLPVSQIYKNIFKQNIIILLAMIQKLYNANTNTMTNNNTNTNQNSLERQSRYSSAFLFVYRKNKSTNCKKKNQNKNKKSQKKNQSVDKNKNETQSNGMSKSKNQSHSLIESQSENDNSGLRVLQQCLEESQDKLIRYFSLKRAGEIRTMTTAESMAQKIEQYNQDLNMEQRKQEIITVSVSHSPKKRQKRSKIRRNSSRLLQISQSPKQKLQHSQKLVQTRTLIQQQIQSWLIDQYQSHRLPSHSELLRKAHQISQAHRSRNIDNPSRWVQTFLRKRPHLLKLRLMCEEEAHGAMERGCWDARIGLENRKYGRLGKERGIGGNIRRVVIVGGVGFQGQNIVKINQNQVRIEEKQGRQQEEKEQGQYQQKGKFQFQQGQEEGSEERKPLPIKFMSDGSFYLQYPTKMLQKILEEDYEQENQDSKPKNLDQQNKE